MLEHLHDIDVVALLVAALCHDVDHPGFNNGFQITTQSELALLHNDISVLENHHAYVTSSLLRKPENNIFVNVNTLDILGIRSTIVKSILATDMAHHFDLCKELDGQDPALGSCERENPQHRLFLVKLIVHSSDLAGQCAPLRIAKVWQELVAIEFARQARTEYEQGVAVTAFMDKLDEVETCYQNHINFIDFVMVPLWNGVCRLLPELNACQEYLTANRRYFAEMVSKEKLNNAAA